MGTEASQDVYRDFAAKVQRYREALATNSVEAEDIKIEIESTKDF